MYGQCFLDLSVFRCAVCMLHISASSDLALDFFQDSFFKNILGFCCLWDLCDVGFFFVHYF